MLCVCVCAAHEIHLRKLSEEENIFFRNFGETSFETRGEIGMRNKFTSV